MFRFSSWLVVGIAAAFLVVATAAFSAGVTVWLAFGISIGTLVVSTGVVSRCRGDVASLVIGLTGVLVSGWTIIASLVFTASTMQTLALASALALSGLAIGGLTAHEIEHEYVVYPRERAETPGTSESRLSAAA